MDVKLKIPSSIAYVFTHAQQQMKITCAKLVGRGGGGGGEEGGENEV